MAANDHASPTSTGHVGRATSSTLSAGGITLTAPAPAAGPSPQRAAARPAPRLRQLMGVCGWAAVLGGVGLIIGIRGLFGVIGNDAPGWYEPLMTLTGLAGIGLTVGAFLTVRRPREPWLMLGLASVALVVGMVLTTAAF
ncbi:MAG TPA: hypothetical protein VF163_17900 [Micromonosporaceae bacterium]